MITPRSRRGGSTLSTAPSPPFLGDIEQPGDQNAMDDLIAIEPLPGAAGYGDMQDGREGRARDPHARELLQGGLNGPAPLLTRALLEGSG